MFPIETPPLGSRERERLELQLSEFAELISERIGREVEIRFVDPLVRDIEQHVSPVEEADLSQFPEFRFLVQPNLQIIYTNAEHKREPDNEPEPTRYRNRDRGR